MYLMKIYMSQLQTYFHTIWKPVLIHRTVDRPCHCYLEGCSSSIGQCTGHVTATGGPALTASPPRYTTPRANGNLKIISLTILFTVAFQNPPNLGKNLSFSRQLVTQHRSRKQHLLQIL
jgi:hypothetical protein